MFRNLGVLAAAAVLLGGCTGIIGSDKLCQQSRQVESFDRISVGHGIGLEVKVGEAISVVVSGDDNIVPIIETKVENGKLEIGVDDNLGMMPRKPLVVLVRVPSLVDLDVSGGSKATATGVDSPEFSLNASGGSQVTLTGRATRLVADASGGSQLHLQDLATQTAKLNASGGSQASVQVVQSLDVDASGGSKVTVSGGGAIRSDVSGGSEVKAE